MRYTNNMMSPNALMERSMGVIAVGTAVIGAGVNMYNANKNREIAEGQYIDAKKERDTQQQKLDLQKAEYKRMDFKNPFSNIFIKFIVTCISNILRKIKKTFILNAIND